MENWLELITLVLLSAKVPVSVLLSPELSLAVLLTHNVARHTACSVLS